MITDMVERITEQLEDGADEEQAVDNVIGGIISEDHEQYWEVVKKVSDKL
jgi:hypothetical protein